VEIDEPGRHYQTAGVDHARGAAGEPAPDGDDRVLLDRHVAEEPRIAGAVHDAAIPHE
jgi:hypothetical protein